MAIVPLKHKKATNVYQDGIRTVVRLYGTEIVTFNDKYISVNHGGYLTHTTIRRMNEASREFDLGFQVSSKNGVMQVNFKDKIFLADLGAVILTR